jgi:deoxyribodipyrimidine photo-lyase
MMANSPLPHSSLPLPDPEDVPRWVGRHLGHLLGGGTDDDGEPQVSNAFTGGQSAADRALALLDITGYAAQRNEVWPQSRRGATRLSPYIRHGLLTLPQVWAHVADAPYADREKFRDELMWQEYARHLYARGGQATSESLRAQPVVRHTGSAGLEHAWDRRMACIDMAMQELNDDGWLPNQVRMWMASQWSVRHGWDWRLGEQEFFARLLDGSRAANRLGWQWTVGAGTGRPYAFSRWQVRNRAPGLCEGCALSTACPIEQVPEIDEPTTRPADGWMRRDDDVALTAGPTLVQRRQRPEAVWITAESLGVHDPAMAAHPDLPAVFVFDEPLLTRIRLHGPRLVFLVQTLAELALQRPVRLHLGVPSEVLANTPVAATFAPVPGWRRHARVIDPVEAHPWPWLLRPGAGPLTSFTAWRKGLHR